MSNKIDWEKVGVEWTLGELQEQEERAEATVPPTANYVHSYVLQAIETVLTCMRTGSHNSSPAGQVVIRLDIGSLDRARMMLAELMEREAA